MTFNLTSLNLHQINSITISPVQERKESAWQTITINFDAAKFEINLFPADKKLLPLLEPTKQQ